VKRIVANKCLCLSAQERRIGEKREETEREGHRRKSGLDSRGSGGGPAWGKRNFLGGTSVICRLEPNSLLKKIGGDGRRGSKAEKGKKKEKSRTSTTRKTKTT